MGKNITSRRDNCAKSATDVPHRYRLRLATQILNIRPTVQLAPGMKEGCRVWPKHRSKKGYGQTSMGGKAMWVHRASYLLFVGPLEEGMSVHHECDNTGCCEPRHLKQITLAKNTSLRRKQAKPIDDRIPIQEEDDDWGV